MLINRGCYVDFFRRNTLEKEFHGQQWSTLITRLFVTSLKTRYVIINTIFGCTSLVYMCFESNVRTRDDLMNSRLHSEWSRPESRLLVFLAKTLHYQIIFRQGFKLNLSWRKGGQHPRQEGWSEVGSLSLLNAISSGSMGHVTGHTLYFWLPWSVIVYFSVLAGSWRFWMIPVIQCISSQKNLRKHFWR